MIKPLKINLTFRLASIEDFEGYYKLKCEKSHIAWSGFREKPDYERIKEWYKKELKNSNKLFFIAFLKGNSQHIAGYLTIVLDGDKAELSSDGVLEEFQGKGVGTALIRYGRDYIIENLPNINEIIGWVAEENVPSEKTVTKNGFMKTSEIEKRFLSFLNKYLTFVKYIYYIPRNEI